MTTRIGAPQVGQWAASGGGGGARRRLALVGVSLHEHQADGLGRDGTAGMEKAEVADLHDSRAGKTCWRNLRRNSMTSRWAVRRRALPTLR